MLKTDSKFRMALILINFVIGVFLVFLGWTFTGKMSGLIIMFVGVLLLLVALWVYNLPYKN